MTSVQQPHHNTTTDLASAFIQGFWNREDVVGSLRLLSPTYVDHAYSPSTSDGLVRTHAELTAAFPDHQTTVEAMVAADDMVVLRLRLRGTHQGTFRGIAPTNRAIDVQVYRTFRIEHDMIAEHWALLDTMSLFRQLGETPFHAPACARPTD